jgi:hypothetical protein
MVACLTMTITTHAIVGAAAASFFPEQPYLAFAAGFASHFIIDSFPHRDYGDQLRSLSFDSTRPLENTMPLGREFVRDLKWLGGDALLGFLLTFVVARILGISYELALVGAGAGIYPDFLQFIYIQIRKTPLVRVLYHLQYFHSSIQEGKEHYEWSLAKGLSLQAGLAVVVIAVAYLL